MSSSLSCQDLISIAGKEFTSHRIIFLSFFFISWAYLINGFSLSSFFWNLTTCAQLWIGAQFPREKFLSYARILDITLLFSSYVYLIFHLSLLHFGNYFFIFNFLNAKIPVIFYELIINLSTFHGFISLC
jgi:hypothetical protein